MQRQDRVLYLCGGTQSSGSTLVSWCFLQRADMNGFLDADNDILTVPPVGLGCPFIWYKTTISSFRLVERVDFFLDEGWTVRPLLVVRDVRKVWASLARKPYGRNGNTAEDPPFRTRLRRFKEDWDLFRSKNWPTLQYEALVAQPERALRETCERLGLPWDASMLTWPKKAEDIAGTRHGNKTFRSSIGQGLLATIRPEADGVPPDSIPSADLEWLEHEFREFNVANGYPAHIAVPRSQPDAHTRAVPCFEVTRRHRWELRRNPLRRMAYHLSRRRAIDSRG